MEEMTLDPHKLRGLAHPLRVRLLGLLREQGPSTASKLAQRLGQSSGATSYHLRQLAAHGFVTDEPGRGTQRERWWRAVHRSTHLDAATGRADPVAAEGYLRAIATSSYRQVEDAISELPTLPPEWQDAVSFSTTTRRLTAAQTAELRDRLQALLDEYPAESAAADAEPVVVNWQLFPVVRR
ncbi:winged helix-turn-helix domain-containing protein [Symbioplanes lichenis]|uniref:winged helix-turn-helix domain-containing protein n=1 Tax=Symbioplanes lichenis TaxID=1629072 RepID=UPI00273977D6|nr:winged helix-turn-helix domain-containing protein [Actinoplanes lichenis]